MAIYFNEQSRQFSADSVYNKYKKKYDKLREEGHSHELAIKKLTKEANLKKNIGGTISGGTLGAGIGTLIGNNENKLKFKGASDAYKSMGYQTRLKDSKGNILDPNKHFKSTSIKGGLATAAGLAMLIGHTKRTLNREKAIDKLNKENK